MAEKGNTDETLLTKDDTDGADDQADDKGANDKGADDQADDSADDKSDDKDSAGDKSDDDKSDGEAGAPEEYEDFTLPEDSPVDADKVAEIKTLAKELDLTQENAQKVADLLATTAEENKQVLYDALETVKTNWIEEVKADKEIGGADHEEKLGSALKAMGRFGSDGLKAVLESTGLGNHPEMVRCFYKIGKAISEDKFVEGEDAGKEKPFYEKSNHKV